MDAVSDKVKNTSWRDVGATGGKKIDQVRNKVNEKFVDVNGVTPEQHFKVCIELHRKKKTNTSMTWIYVTDDDTHASTGNLWCICQPHRKYVQLRLV